MRSKSPKATTSGICHPRVSSISRHIDSLPFLSIDSLPMLRIHNTLSGQLEELRPLEGEVKFYYCGPTVWDYGHIGNFRSAIAADVLRRYLKFKGLRVTQAMNITDVDDRIITKAQESGKSIDDYTQKYIEAFWEDFDALGCE